MDLTGGYYDAGDNVKFGLPMAFTTTMLSWSVLEFGEYMGDDLDHAKTAIRWATDYLLKAAAHPGVLYVQVMHIFFLRYKERSHVACTMEYIDRHCSRYYGIQ